MTDWRKQFTAALGYRAGLRPDQTKRHQAMVLHAGASRSVAGSVLVAGRRGKRTANSASSTQVYHTSVTTEARG